MVIDIKPSTQKDKRFMADFGDRSIHFGAPSPSQAFVDHGDIQKKDAWLARHKVRGDWADPYTAGALSRWILWDTRDIATNIKRFKARFKL